MKRNNEIDIIVFMNKFNLILWLVITIINFINLIIWNNNYIVVICLTVYFMQILYNIISVVISEHNTKVMLKLWEKEKEDFYNNLNIRNGEKKNEKNNFNS